MKIKGFIISGILICFVGIIMLITSITTIMANPKNLSVYEINDKKIEFVDAINNINVDFVYSGVSIIKKDVDDITVNYFESKYSNFDINIDGQTLVVKENSIKRMPWYIKSICIGFNASPTVEIIVPSSYTIDSNVKIDFGNIKYDGIFNDTFIEASASNIEISNSIFNNLSIKGNACKIRLNDISTNDFTIDINAGDIKLNCVSANIFTCINDASDVNLNNLTAQKIIIEADASDIDFSQLISDDIKLDINAGDIEGTIKGIKSEYTITIDKNAGRSNLSNQTGTSLKTLDIKINAGEIEIDFI